MAAVPLRSSLVEQVLSGKDPELGLLAARGVLPLPPEELIHVQIRLAASGDTTISRTARTSLRQTEPRLILDFIHREASSLELAFFAAEEERPQVLEAILRRRDVPRTLLREMAPRLEVALQEILILRQDAIIEEPGILAALERNPELDAAVLRRVREYREHLLPREHPSEAVEREGGEAALEEGGEEPTDEEVQAAIREVARVSDEGERDEITGLTEGQIRLLPVPVRMKLSRGASRALRAILVRDNNLQVALSTLKNNALSDDEVEQIARSRAVVDDVLVELARHRDWMSKYGIINALVANPRTPLSISIRLVPRLGIRDLRSLTLNRNVPDAVRFTARNLYAVKTK